MIQIILIFAVVLLVLYRQLSEQEVTHKTKSYLLIMLIGLYFVYQQSSHMNWNSSLLLAVVFGDIAIPVLFGWLRAVSTHVYLGTKGNVVRKGSLLTLALWVIYIIIRGSISYFIKDSENFMLFSLGLSLLVQREIIWKIAQEKFSSQLKNIVSH